MVTLRVTASDRRPSLPGGDRPAIQWSTRARRGARRAGGAAPSDFRRGPAPAAPREPRTPPLPGSPSGDEENAGRMSWAGQLWKQYDPINKIIFPGVGARPTYNERGASRGPRATPSLRCRASPVASSRPRRPIQQTHARSLQKTAEKVEHATRKDSHKRVSARVSHSGDERRVGFFFESVKRSRLEKSRLIHENKLPSLSLLRTFVKGKPFVGELQVRDVIYKTVVVKLPVLVPGGLCAPPRRIECPCLAVLRADAKQLKACKGKACVLYLHGNGTDIGGAAEEAKTLARELDCHVLVPEYPGYGLAEGESSEDSVDAATHAAVRFAVETLGVPHERLVIYGRSVGTGPAAAAAARMTSHSPLGPPGALVLHSPYTSIFEYAREKAGGLLSYLLVSERWPTRANLTKVGCPTLLIHGDRDEVIPFRHSAKLRKDAAKRANAQKGGAAERRDRTSDRGSNDSGSPRGETPRHETGSAQTGLVQLHVQKNASHNVFDFYGDVADPIASFLKRHERAPWRAGGEQREPMRLDLRHLDARVQESGPGEMEEYPFASAAV